MGKHAVKWLPSRRSEMIAEYRAGVGTSTLAERYGSSRGGIIRVLNEAGVSTKRVRRALPPRFNWTTAASNIFDDALSFGLTITAAGRWVGASPSQARSRFDAIRAELGAQAA